MTQQIRATYLIETAYPLDQAAAAMAGEQSSGTFVALPGETDALRARHGAQVLEMTPMDSVATPSLPGSRPPPGEDGRVRYQRARVVIGYPLENLGPSLPNLMTTVAGNLFELGHFSGLRLLDIELPQAFAGAYPGPQFGIAGTRELAGVYKRPLIGTIIKPSVGLTPAQTADLVDILAGADLDFIKDDELIASPPYSTIEARVGAVMPVIHRHADRTGRKVMYAFNITGEIEEMKRRHDTVLAGGGTCVMVSLNSVGPAGVLELCRHSQLPVHAHRNGWGALSRDPLLGFSFVAWQKFWRLAGVDHIHVNGLRNKFCEADESVIASARACLTPILGGYEIMPVFSSGQWAGQAPDTYAALNSVDLIYLAGGGIIGHPSGPAAGAASLRQAWEAATAGISLASYGLTHPELQEALAAYGAH